MSPWLRCALRTVALLGWLIAAADAVPVITHYLSPEVGRLALTVGAVGSIAVMTRRLMRPATELYLAGKEAGRREALAELGARPEGRVVNLADWRH